MTIEELKQTLDTQATELKEVKTQNEQLKADIEKKDESIKNLDESVKEQAKAIEELKKDRSQKLDLKQAIYNALHNEHKAAIEAFLKDESKGDRMRFEVKLDSGITNRAAFGGVNEPGVSSVPTLPRAFLANLPVDDINGVQVNWLEGSYTSNAAYVDELAAVASDDSASVTEKHRAFGKIAAHLPVSSEVKDFLDMVYQWAIGEAQAKIDNKADEEIFKGAGSDANYPKKVYGIKGQATAFSALGTYKLANYADVIKDACAQAAKAGFLANVAFVSYDDLPEIQGLKDENGNYLYNQITGYLGQCRIIPSAQLSTDECLVGASTVMRIKRRPVWEFEIVRNAAKDGYDVYVRRAYQALVKTGDKGGVIYVQSVATAKAAILQAGSMAESLAKLAGTVNDDNQIETHPNSDSAEG